MMNPVSVIRINAYGVPGKAMAAHIASSVTLNLSSDNSYGLERSCDCAEGEVDADCVSSQTCPFLIRLFLTKGKHVPLLDFDDGKLPIRDEFQVYGW